MAATGTIISDQDIANSVISYLLILKPGNPCWCATVEFVNPLDGEYGLNWLCVGYKSLFHHICPYSMAHQIINGVHRQISWHSSKIGSKKSDWDVSLLKLKIVIFIWRVGLRGSRKVNSKALRRASRKAYLKANGFSG
ncbi:MAG: hypothetical protein H7843_12945 [Nitrospirota bacterium]